MTSPRIYWQGQQFVAEWTLRGLDGTTVDDATVSGEVTRPDGTTAAMAVTQPTPGTYRAAYPVAAPGTHTYSLTATGTAEDAVQGKFVAARDLVGLPPITVDPATPVGMVRLRISDLDEATPLFEDAQLAALILAEGGNVKRGAAAALEIIAGSEVLISKVISTQDLTTNGAAVAAELRALAKTLREQAAEEEQDGGTAPGQNLLPLYAFPPPVPHGDMLL
ncbi:hypothetical protein AB0L22_08995 [Micromonospora haikouensis]|uniref:hypothetical protein n=1 Tax=Micromonospora haikouensis TaxID=686309 RepID=UPI0034270BE5